MRTLTIAAAFAVLFTSSSGAKQPDKKFQQKAEAEPKLDTSFTASDIRIGNQLTGAELAADDLKGKVVVIEFWGANCPLCLAALPETAALHADLADFGLVVIGAHCQNAPAEHIKAVARARGVNFPVTERTTIAKDIPALPHAIVFDHTGACVFRGSPRDAEVKARQAIGAVLVRNAGRDNFAPQLAPVVAELKKGQSPHLMLPRVTAQLSGPESAAEDAKALLVSLTAVGQKKYDRAKERAEADPVGAFLLVEGVPVSHKGTPLAAAAAELVIKLKQNKAVAAELAARTREK